MEAGSTVPETSEAGMPRSSGQGCTFAFSGTILPASMEIMNDFRLGHYQKRWLIANNLEPVSYQLQANGCHSDFFFQGPGYGPVTGHAHWIDGVLIHGLLQPAAGFGIMAAVPELAVAEKGPEFDKPV